MSTPADPQLEQAQRLVDELRARCTAEGLGEHPEELLIEGYASALALEGARRRLRAQALALSERELALAAQERELRALLSLLRERIGQAARAGEDDGHGLRGRRPASGDEAASQRLH